MARRGEARWGMVWQGNAYGEYAVRADTIDEFKARNEQVSKYALEELKKLNG